ncbi:MAG TPA: Ig-like domain-containing protein, partial [Candidatus Gracilibacteria bacterium]|nr:Ig-like domain-containing protein [Candidatus Gracilibacteria bacterium]
DANARGEGWNSVLKVADYQVAVKTGTSNKRVKDKVVPSDGWTVGYSPTYTTIVWAGNNDGTPINSAGSGFVTAGPIFQKTMLFLLKQEEKQEFSMPDDIKKVSISRLSGKLPGKNFSAALITSDIFSALNMPTEYDNALDFVTIDKVTGKLPNEFTPEESKQEIAVLKMHSLSPQNPDWENPVRSWVKNYGAEMLKELGVENVLVEVPQEIDDVHTAQSVKEIPVVRIISPEMNGVVGSKRIQVSLEIEAKHGVSMVEYYLAESLVDTQTTYPYTGNISLPNTAKVGDKFTIQAKVYDTIYNTNTSSVTVSLAEDSEAPQVEIVYPKDQAILNGGSIVSVQTFSVDKQGGIAWMDFYLDRKR